MLAKDRVCFLGYHDRPSVGRSTSVVLLSLPPTALLSPGRRVAPTAQVLPCVVRGDIEGLCFLFLPFQVAETLVLFHEFE